jgi:hypothetical protein
VRIPAKTARNAIARRTLRTSECSVVASRSGSRVSINHKKTPAKSAAPPSARKAGAGLGSDRSNILIG